MSKLVAATTILGLVACAGPAPGSALAVSPADALPCSRLSIASSDAVSNAGRFDFGLRGGTTLGDGKPANDMITYGVFGRYHVNNRFSFGVGVELLTFDFEEPAPRVLGIATSATFDAGATSVLIEGAAEFNLLPADSLHELVVHGGVGCAAVSVDDLRGTTASGGTFDIDTNAGTELLFSIGAGYRFQLSQHWNLEALARYNHHLADWSVRDSVSGASATVNDYGTTSLLLGFSHRF